MTECEAARAYQLARCLPAESRTARAVDARAQWSETDYILAYIADNLAFLRYELGGCKGSKPKPLKRPRNKKPIKKEKTVHGWSCEQVRAALTKPRV